MRHLVLGFKGQVGSAVHEVLQDAHPYVDGLDLLANFATGRYGCIHCCLPYGPSFDGALTTYLDKYAIPGALIIIHATVPVGTSEQYGAVHSPIRGVHPNLAAGIQTFVKYFGGPRAHDAARVFLPICPVKITDSARNTEALKLWDTTYYGWNIVFEKAVHAYCEANGLDFDLIYTHANNTYNLGYETMHRTDVQRPILEHKPGPIGGHCVLPNAQLLGGIIANFILDHKE